MGTYYLSPTGSDSNSGTISSPWASLDKFYQRPAVAGDVLYVRGGTYSSGVSTHVYTPGGNPISGASGSPITVMAYPGESPLFTGTDAPAIYWAYGSSHHTLDGLRFSGWTPDDTGILVVGSNNGASYITIRNVTVDMPGGLTSNEHAVYFAADTDHCTLEYSIIRATSTTGGAGFHIYHNPGPTNTLVQRNVFVNWGSGCMVWDVATTGSILHNTFINCDVNIDLRVHSYYTVRDNAGEDGTSANLYDPDYSGYTTADHNFWAQEFDGNYYLLTGETGIDAASTGDDAGALDTNPSAPGPATGLKHAFVSAKTDGADTSLVRPSDWNAEHVIGTCRILSGAGTPETYVTAPIGSLYLRTDGSTSTTLYVKTSGTGNTGWTAK